MNALKLQYKWLVGVVFVLAIFLDLLDMTIVTVAIPTLAEEFETDTTTIEWVVTGYLLSLALFIPVSGWLGDRFGTKRVFITAVAIFVAGSVLAGLAWDIESLIAFRVLQGVGGGMITPVGFAMLFRAFPASEFAKASAVLAIPMMIAPAAGPLLGGYLVDYYDWRWIFFINLPVGIVALTAAALLLREEVQENPGRLDLFGLVLSGAGLVAVVYALAEAGLHGFDDPQVMLFGLGGLALLAAFTLVELRTKEPLIDIRLLGNKLFGAGNVVHVTILASQMGAFFLLPIFLQAQKGLDPFDVGLVTFPTAIGVALTAQPAAWLYEKVGPRRMLLAGFTGAMALNFSLALVNYETSDWWIAANALARGPFFALIFVAVEPAAFATLRPQDMGRASAIFNTGRQVASSLGVAVIATVLTNRLVYHDAILGDPATRDAALTAFQDTFIFGGALGVLGIIASLWIDDRKVAEATAKEFVPAEADRDEAGHIHLPRPSAPEPVVVDMGGE
jgi:EmrB/QacA subfamily drug resistance transporter